MILAMARQSCHLAILCRTDRLRICDRRLTALALSVLLSAAPALPQSSASPALPSAAVPEAATSGTTSAHPDKARARNAYQAGRRAEQSGDWKLALDSYSEATGYDPSNPQYAVLKEHARFQVVQGIVDSAERQAIAGNIPRARALLAQALQIDPNYSLAQERLTELSTGPEQVEQGKGPRLAGLPRLTPNLGTRDFDYHGTTRGAYEEIGRQFGVTMVFDGDLADRQVQFQVPHVDFDTAVMVLSRQTRTFTRVVDAHTMFVTEDSPQKVREYALEVEKGLLLPAAVTTDEMNEIVRMVREMTGIARTQLNTATRTLTVRSTEQNVALAQAILEQIEQPHGELMLEIELLQVDRDAAHQLGIVPPSSSSVFALTLPEIRRLQAAQNNGTLIQILQSIFGSSAVSSATGSALPALIAFGGGKTIFLASMPSVTANFSQALSAVRSAQRILLRAQDEKPATFFVGDRYPITLSLLSSNLSPATSTLEQALLTGQLPRTDYDLGKGRGPVAVAIAQFNNTNGHLDLAVANQTDGTISILQGNGDGTFVKPATSCTAAMPVRSCIALPGLMSGTMTVPAKPTAIALGDFNRDGNQDIAVTDSANSVVWILLGNGDGTFKTPVSYSTISSTATAGSGNPVALVALDFDGDGDPDLAVVNQGDGKTAGSVAILLGNKKVGVQDGTFTLQSPAITVGVSPSAITSADFDADSTSDLAVTNQADSTVSILLGNKKADGTPDGTFTLKNQNKPLDTGKGPAGIATADFNGDSRPDLAVTNQTDGTASIFLGNGDGTFSPASTPTVTTGSGPIGIAAATVTSGIASLAVADNGASNVDLLIGKGDGTFASPLSLPTGNAPVAVAVADLAGTGAPDLVAVNNSSSSVTVYLNSLTSLSSTPSSETPYPGSEYVDLGLKVKATPRLHDNGDVTLQLVFDIKSLSGSNVNGIPVLRNRNIEQTIRLREGETSILSGLLQENESRSVSGVPWTSLAPGIGLLTGENTTDHRQTELLILVTPHALRLPPHDVPAIYAGRGEPATPPAGPPPPVPPVPPQPGAQPGGAPPFPPKEREQFPPRGGQQPLGGQPGQFPGGIFGPPQEQRESQ